MNEQDFCKLCEQFQPYLRTLEYERQLSSHSISNYQRQLSACARILASQGINHWQQVDVSLVRFMVSESHKLKLSGKSLALRLSVLRSFFDFLLASGQISLNPAKMVKAPKQAKHLPKNIDRTSMEQLLNFTPHNHLDWRDLAMMELMYSSGLRLSELQGLDLGDLDLLSGEVIVLGKGSKERVVPIGRQARAVLHAYLAVRSQFNPQENALFLNKKGETYCQSHH